MPAIRRNRTTELFWALHRWLYVTSGGRIGSQLFGMHVLLLTTAGRKTGKPRTAALNYIFAQGKIAIVASNAGERSNPSWYLNLRSNPRATIQIRDRHIEVTAREVFGDERRGLWDKIVEADGSYAQYQTRTERQIPVIMLEPTRGSG